MASNLLSPPDVPRGATNQGTHPRGWGAGACAVTLEETIPRAVVLQTLENKALSRGIIGKSTPILAEITLRKSHPLEGSCQEAIPLPSTTFDMFFVVFRSAHATPDWPSQTHPCFHSRGVGSDAPHQSPIRFKASCRLASSPDVCPWHRGCPRKPSVPCRVQSCLVDR